MEQAKDASTGSEYNSLQSHGCENVTFNNYDLQTEYTPVQDTKTNYAVTSVLGQLVEVFESCAKGTCLCVYHIDGVRTQLKPCRFASLILSGTQTLSSLDHNEIPHIRTALDFLY